MPTTIAVVEDDADQRDTYVDVLIANGYAVDAYADKASAQSGFRMTLPDLAILDIMLGQDMDGGFDLCMELRNRSQTLPVIFITARDSDVDRISSQRMMAWDYITKPVSLEFLVARVHALLSIANHLQSPESNPTTLTINELEIDENSMSIQWQGERLNFTLTEFQIVESLARRPGHVKTYDALIEVTRQGLVEKNTINGYIRRIRSKFREIDTTFNRIQTVHGTGYKWAQD
ncbi:response regulator transcription factor [Gammaproteobacteria bacterium]|nr:response regulator transcription factor [Gammaproteobacteria bacterium]